jgi:prepilin-type N-terminal cleavage/methylation domain-containing protein
MSKYLNQAGDTIIEVLVAIIVLSSVLAGAYGIASRATKENMQTQEHSQALQIAQGQLEALKAQTSPPTSPFCITNSNTIQVWGPTPPAANAQDDSLGTIYPSACQQNLTGGSCDTSLCYYVAIKKADSSNDDNVTVRWPGANGGNDQVSLAYRWNP